MIYWTADTLQWKDSQPQPRGTTRTVSEPDEGGFEEGEKSDQEGDVEENEGVSGTKGIQRKVRNFRRDPPRIPMVSWMNLGEGNVSQVPKVK